VRGLSGHGMKHSTAPTLAAPADTNSTCIHTARRPATSRTVQFSFVYIYVCKLSGVNSENGGRRQCKNKTQKKTTAKEETRKTILESNYQLV